MLKQEAFFLHFQASKENCSMYPIICWRCHEKHKYISFRDCNARAVIQNMQWCWEYLHSLEHTLSKVPLCVRKMLALK